MQTIIDYVRERIPSSKLTAFDGKCPRCGGSGKISDPSDDTAKYAEAGQIAKGLAPQIEKEEAKLGNGGNRVTLIQSNDYKKVGLVMNNSPSYRVDHDAGYRNKGNAGPDVVNPKFGLQIPEGATANHVQGINPIATPGGSYILECTNRFSVVAGALGVDITTGGPVTIKGGITQIIGPEVTIGSRTGKLALEGDVVNIVGKSVEIAPTDGHMYVRGTISNSGNLMVGGHGHLESASVVKLETVGRNETSKPSAPSNLYGGPAYWGGQSVEAITATAKELLAYVTSNTTNPEIAKLITTPRYITGLQDCMKNLLYVSKPEELVQTGYALYLGLQLPVYNFPHIHAIPDQIHVHDTRIPDIDCTADTAQELRSRQAGVNGPAPIGKKSTSIVDVAVSVWSAVSLAFAAVWSRFTNNYKT